MLLFGIEIKYWLLSIAVALVTIHLNLSQKLGSDFLSHSFLFWLAATVLVWQKRDELSWQSDRLSTTVGCTILALVLYRSLHLFPEDYFLQISPLLSLLGWGLMASGYKGLKQYNRAFLLLAFLAIPWELAYIFDITQLTARFSAFILWLGGFTVSRQGIWLILPTGSVEVYNGCSGVRMIAQLLGLCWLILAIVPTNRRQKILLPVMAIAIGFVVNGIRVALMAILVGLSDSQGFDYWHIGTGSLIFSAIAVLLFSFISIKVTDLRSVQL